MMCVGVGVVLLPFELLCTVCVCVCGVCVCVCVLACVCASEAGRFRAPRLGSVCRGCVCECVCVCVCVCLCVAPFLSSSLSRVCVRVWLLSVVFDLP